MLGGDGPRQPSTTRRVAGRGSRRGCGQGRLQEVFEGLGERRGRGEVGFSRSPGELGTRLVTGLAFVTLQCAVMVMMSPFDSHFVRGGLLQGRVSSTQPGEGSDGLGEDNEQRQDGRGHSPGRSPIQRETLMVWSR